MHSMDVVHTAYKSNLKTLVAAIDAAGLSETLMNGGPFTMFAPTDEAFTELPEGTLDNLLKPENKETLTNILTYHVVPGKVMAYDVFKLKSATTVNGEEISITNNEGIKVNDASVTQFDIMAKNGVIHKIDKVLLPN
ncbi:MAG: fasciclin domain-containing protein [Deltaproteobacteria bacterium]|nr:fasciclin domain-containing protein [Deltaproteobacteria bacterium]